MTQLLFCIKCGKMVKPYQCPEGVYHYFTVQVNNSPDPGTRYDVVECGFEEGWATAPMPEFDMEQFIETVEPELQNGLVGYDYDVQSDQIITEAIL